MAVSCNSDEDYYTDRVPIFKVVGPDGTEASDIAISGRAQSVPFKVYATGGWTAEVSDAVYSLSVSSGGVGITTVSLISPSNETGAERSAVLTFKFATGEERAFNVTQEQQYPYFDVDVTEVSLNGDGESFTVNVETNQDGWSYDLGDAASWLTETSSSSTSVTLAASENTGDERKADVRFYATGNPELYATVSVTQRKPVSAPVADLLDVVFNADRTASDASAMGMAVNSDRLDADVSTRYVDRYSRYAAVFTNTTVARNGLGTGYYYIPYTMDSGFGKKLEDGFTYELLFCSYTDAQAIQVKPFSSTQAGGTGMCFRAATGELNFEVHTGGEWRELYSGVLPAKNQYYHVVATWDKTAGVAKMYVDGELKAQASATGDFDFMSTSVDKRWFGIGADPTSDDKGEASFNGEVVIARLYDKPVSADEVRALYKQVR
jgi:glycerophosphoryl diester phosphodiesterase